jgi:hypothetical protein
MSSSPDHGGMDASKDKRGEVQTNTSKLRRGLNRDVSSASASNIGKAKRKLPVPIAKPSREPSPIRSFGSKTPQYQGQHQRSTNPATSPTDSLQTRPLQPLPNTARSTNSRTPPPDTRPLASSLHKKSDTPTPHPTNTDLVRQEDSERAEGPNDNVNAQILPTNSSTALSTVVESSQPATTAIGSSKSLEDSVAALAQRQYGSQVSLSENIAEETDTDSTSTVTRKGRAGSVSSSIAPSSTAESESESGYRSEDKTPTSSLHRVPPPTRVFGRRPTVTGKDTSSKAMTVETETVSSVPQVGLGQVGGTGGASIRSKRSTDTIRAPRRDKKRTAKRAVAAGPSNRGSPSPIP